MYPLYASCNGLSLFHFEQCHCGGAYESIRQLSTRQDILDLTLFRSQHSFHVVSNSPFIHGYSTRSTFLSISLYLSAFATRRAQVQFFSADEWIEVATGNSDKKRSENVMARRRRTTKKKNRLSTTYSSRSFLYLISCIQWIVWSKIVEASTHPNSQQWSERERKKRRQPSTLTSTFVFEATNAAEWPHCWSVDNLLILTYGCNDVDFYRMINTMTIGTLSILSFSLPLNGCGQIS